MNQNEIFQAQLKKFGFDPTRDKVVAKLKDHSNDPYIVKKVNNAIVTLKRVGFPPELLKRQAERQRVACQK